MGSRANHRASTKKAIVLSLLFILYVNIFITQTAFSDIINPNKTNPPIPVIPPIEPITPPENPTPNPVYPPQNPTPTPRPAPEPNSCQSGSSETYQCIDNKIQQLYDRNCPTEHWVTINDCNQCGDPPCQCVGGVCVHMDGPNSTNNPKECDQQACQAQNQKIGVPYTKDGKSYQKYKECNCKDGECQCESVDKEIPSECQDIKFQGEVIEAGSNGFDPLCQGTRTMMDYPYYVIKIKKLISGPQPNEDTIRLQVNPYWKSEDDCSINPKGSYDKGITKGDAVEVLGCYEADGPRVSISDKDYYYIMKIASDCSNPPTLSDSKVTPDCGPKGSEFTFSVVYKDPAGGEPTTANIWIKGWEGTNTIPVYESEPYNQMIKEMGADITKGATYYFKKNLPANGKYQYVIYFVSKKGCRVDLPPHGFSDNLGLLGPRVNPQCSSSGTENNPENYDYTMYVKDSKGNLIDGAEVYIDGTKVNMQADSNRVKLSDGPHTATATKTCLGTGSWKGTLNHNVDKDFIITIRIPDGEYTIGVTDSDGKSISGADVTVYETDKNGIPVPRWSGKSDINGRVSVPISVLCKKGIHSVQAISTCIMGDWRTDFKKLDFNGNPEYVGTLILGNDCFYKEMIDKLLDEFLKSG